MKNIPKNSHLYFPIENNRFLNVDVDIREKVIEAENGDDSIKNSVEDIDNGGNKDDIISKRYNELQELYKSKIGKNTEIEESVRNIIVKSITKTIDDPRGIEMSDFDEDKNNILSTVEFDSYLEALKSGIDLTLTVDKLNDAFLETNKNVLISVIKENILYKKLSGNWKGINKELIKTLFGLEIDNLYVLELFGRKIQNILGDVVIDGKIGPETMNSIIGKYELKGDNDEPLKVTFIDEREDTDVPSPAIVLNPRGPTGIALGYEGKEFFIVNNRIYKPNLDGTFSEVDKNGIPLKGKPIPANQMNDNSKIKGYKDFNSAKEAVAYKLQIESLNSTPKEKYVKVIDGIYKSNGDGTFSKLNKKGELIKGENNTISGEEMMKEKTNFEVHDDFKEAQSSNLNEKIKTFEDSIEKKASRLEEIGKELTEKNKLELKVDKNLVDEYTKLENEIGQLEKDIKKLQKEKRISVRVKKWLGNKIKNLRARFKSIGEFLKKMDNKGGAIKLGRSVKVPPESSADKAKNTYRASEAINMEGKVQVKEVKVNIEKLDYKSFQKNIGVGSEFNEGNISEKGINKNKFDQLKLQGKTEIVVRKYEIDFAKFKDYAEFKTWNKNVGINIDEASFNSKKQPKSLGVVDSANLEGGRSNASDSVSVKENILSKVKAGEYVQVGDQVYKAGEKGEFLKLDGEGNVLKEKGIKMEKMIKMAEGKEVISHKSFKKAKIGVESELKKHRVENLNNQIESLNKRVAEAKTKLAEANKVIEGLDKGADIEAYERALETLEKAKTLEAEIKAKEAEVKSLQKEKGISVRVKEWLGNKIKNLRARFKSIGEFLKKMDNKGGAIKLGRSVKVPPESSADKAKNTYRASEAINMEGKVQVKEVKVNIEKLDYKSFQKNIGVGSEFNEGNISEKGINKNKFDQLKLQGKTEIVVRKYEIDFAKFKDYAEFKTWNKNVGINIDEASFNSKKQPKSLGVVDSANLEGGRSNASDSVSVKENILSKVKAGEYVQVGDQVYKAGEKGEFLKLDGEGNVLKEKGIKMEKMIKMAEGKEVISHKSFKKAKIGVESELKKLKIDKIKFTPSEISTFEQLGINKGEVAQLEVLSKKNPSIINSLKNSLNNPAEFNLLKKNPDILKVLTKAQDYAFAQKYIDKFAKAGGIVFACFVIYGVENADNKVDFLAKTSAEFGGFMAGAMVAMKIPHPVAKLMVGLVAGIGASLGVGKLWDAHVTPFLDKHMPNRNRDVSGWKDANNFVDFAGKALGGSILGPIDAGLEKLGIAPLEWNQEPLDYLSKTSSFIDFSYEQDGPSTDYLVRDSRNLDKAAKKTLPKLRIWKHWVETMDENKISHSSFPPELKDVYISFIEPLIEKDKKNHGWLHNTLNYTSPKKIRVEAKNQVLKLIDEKIHSFDSVIDGTWLDKKSNELDQQFFYITLVTEKFKEVRINGVPQEKIEEFMDNILKRADSKGALIETDYEYRIWKIMVDKSVTLGGNKITFKDYFSLASLVQKQQKQVSDLKNHGNIRGERL